MTALKRCAKRLTVSIRREVAGTAILAETLMAREAREAPEAVARCLRENRAVIERVATRLRKRPPALVITCARGSSDHAATYAKYLIETLVGVPVASAALSVASIFATPMRASGAMCIAISQHSPRSITIANSSLVRLPCFSTPFRRRRR